MSDITDRLATIAKRYLDREETCQTTIAEKCIEAAKEIVLLRKSLTTAREEGRKQGLDEAAAFLRTHHISVSYVGGKMSMSVDLLPWYCTSSDNKDGCALAEALLALKDKEPGK